MAESRLRGWARQHLLLATALAVIGLGLIGGAVFASIAVYEAVSDDAQKAAPANPGCSYFTDRDVDRLKAVPFEQFVGVKIATEPTCESSGTLTLYIENMHMPPGGSLPADWYDRNQVGTWRAVKRVGPPDSVRLVCYASSDEESNGIELFVGEDGRIGARIRWQHNPCDDL